MFTKLLVLFLAVTFVNINHQTIGRKLLSFWKKPAADLQRTTHDINDNLRDFIYMADKTRDNVWTGLKRFNSVLKLGICPKKTTTTTTTTERPWTEEEYRKMQKEFEPTVYAKYMEDEKKREQKKTESQLRIFKLTKKST